MKVAGDHLADYSFTHGGLKPFQHPRLGVEVQGETAIRYLRFMRPVKIDRLELGRILCGRCLPNVPSHPAHIIISKLNRNNHRWEIIREADLPFDSRIAGEGLSWEMSHEEMNAHFQKVLNEPPQIIKLEGLETDHLRVECDREHPVWSNQGEKSGGTHNVPFGILNSLRAYGTATRETLGMAPYNPLLHQGAIKPKAPGGMKIKRDAMMLFYESGEFSVGFSLRRPMIMHLGWDAFGGEAKRNNRLMLRRTAGYWWDMQLKGLNGPLLATVDMDIGAHLWTGDVEVSGNRVMYRGLHSIKGLMLDATFTVQPDGIIMELHQDVERDIPVLEYEAWRLAWDLRKGIVGAAAMPSAEWGRNGDVCWPVCFAVDNGAGCLALNLREGKPRCQVESYRSAAAISGGVSLIRRGGVNEAIVIPAGKNQAVVEMKIENFEPAFTIGKGKEAEGVKRNWGTVFSCFRPEWRGFSNHSASANCHLSQSLPLEVAMRTKKPQHGPDPAEMTRFTLQRALLDGGGYGYWRNLFMDSDPNLVCAAGRLHQMFPDMNWLKQVDPGLVEALERMGGNIGPEGLAICRDLSGNTGTCRYSTNSWDNIGFGHLDAYSNAWIYRAFKNAMPLMRALGHKTLADQCRHWSEGMLKSYEKTFINKETGWIACWISRDGQIHDYGALFVNGIAIAYGLLSPKAAKRALNGLEKLRNELCPDSEIFGVPCMLLPLRDRDHILGIGNPPARIQPNFEVYTGGSLNAWSAPYYLRALSLNGFKRAAQKLAKGLAKGYLAGYHSGGDMSGTEFRTWEGLPCAYEGTLIGNFGALYSVAVELGYLKPTEPEWWPDNG